jgi:hypothetical protein
MVCNADTRALYWFWQECPYVQWILLSCCLALETKTSEFVFTRLGPDGVQCGHKGYILVLARMSLRPVDSTVVLPCTRVLVVGVTSFQERERILSLFGGV